MVVYKYSGIRKDREDCVETGTVVAQNEAEARGKLKRLKLAEIRLKEINGISGFFKRLRADVR